MPERQIVTGLNPTTSLHRWQSLRSELLFIFDASVPAGGQETVGHREGEFSAWLLRRGSVQMWADGESAVARQGEWLICFGAKIRQKFSPDAEILSLRVLQSWPDGTALYSGSPVSVFRAADHPQVEKSAARLLRGVDQMVLADSTAMDPRFAFLWKTQFDFASYLRYECNLLTWLGALGKALQAVGRSVALPGEVDARIAKACQVIDSVPVGDPFPERTLTRTTGLSLGRLNKLFNQTYGWSVHAHWEKRRLNRARLALEQPDVRVKEVAAQLGFLQLSHFSAWFKRSAGASPRAYRQQMESSGDRERR